MAAIFETNTPMTEMVLTHSPKHPYNFKPAVSKTHITAATLKSHHMAHTNEETKSKNGIKATITNKQSQINK